MTRNAHERSHHNYAADLGLTEARFSEMLAAGQHAQILQTLDQALDLKRWDEHLDDLANERPTWWER